MSNVPAGGVCTTTHDEQCAERVLVISTTGTFAAPMVPGTPVLWNTAETWQVQERLTQEEPRPTTTTASMVNPVPAISTTATFTVPRVPGHRVPWSTAEVWRIPVEGAQAGLYTMTTTASMEK